MIRGAYGGAGIRTQTLATTGLGPSSSWLDLSRKKYIYQGSAARYLFSTHFGVWSDARRFPARTSGGLVSFS